MPFNIGPGELILILVIALVVLGPGKLPDVASSLGKSVREFRKAATDVTEAGRLDTTETAAPATTPAATTPSPVDAAAAAPAAVVDAAPPESGPAAADPDAAVATAGSAAAAPARDPNVS